MGIDRHTEIQAIENKYGLVMFRMGLIHLVDVGIRHFNDESIEAAFKKIEADVKEAEKQGHESFMTPEFQRGIVNCAAELAKYSPLELFKYIKKHL